MTAEEWAALVRDAAEAQEIFGDDELERFAAERAAKEREHGKR